MNVNIRDKDYPLCTAYYSSDKNITKWIIYYEKYVSKANQIIKSGASTLYNDDVILVKVSSTVYQTYTRYIIWKKNTISDSIIHPHHTETFFLICCVFLPFIPIAKSLKPPWPNAQSSVSPIGGRFW